MKLKFKLSILIIFVMILVSAGIAVILLRRASGLSQELNFRAGRYLASQQAEYWKGRENVRLRVLRSLANVMADYEDIDASIRRDRFDAMLRGTLAAEPELISIYTVWRPDAVDGMDARYIDRPGSGPGGQYAASYSREGGQIIAHASSDIAGALTYFSGTRSKQDRVEDPFLRRVGGKETYLLRLMAPIVNTRTNETVGGVGCLLDISAIQSGVEQCLDTNMQVALMAIYSASGFVLGNSAPERIGRMLSDVETLYAENTEEVSRAVAEGREFQCEVHSSVLGSKVRMILYPFRIGNSEMFWTVMLGETEKTVLAEVRALTRFTIFLALIAISAASAIVFFTLSYSTKPLARVTGILQDISEGEGDLTRSITMNSKDELGDLARHFNLTLAKIKNLVVNIKKQAAELSDTGGELSVNMNETAAAVNQITANIQSIKGRVLNQSASVSETNAAMEQITVIISRLSGHIENQASSVAQSSSSVEEMLANIKSVTDTLVKNLENVKDLTKASDSGRAELEDMAADIREIARESEGLMAINAVMQNIASQTNLLSMNAAIEAAHAGEAGKGFAVVADEIRKLAESSGEQSGTISAVLKKIKTSIDKITLSAGSVLAKFEAIDSGVKTVAEQEENIRGAMEEQGAGSKQILTAIGLVKEITEQVRNGSAEMLEGSREVIDEAENLEKATGEITGSMNEMASGVEEINTAVLHVNELSAKNRENIELLVREVSRFKVDVE